MLPTIRGPPEGLVSYKDPRDRRAYAKRHYQRHKPEYLVKAKRLNKKQRTLIRHTIDRAKAAPCVDCGVQYPPHVMQFDHVRGRKDFNLGDLRSSCASLETVRIEIAKCELVCANCHANRTVTRMRENPAPKPEPLDTGTLDLFATEAAS